MRSRIVTCAACPRAVTSKPSGSAVLGIGPPHEVALLDQGVGDATGVALVQSEGRRQAVDRDAARALGCLDRVALVGRDATVAGAVPVAELIDAHQLLHQLVKRRGVGGHPSGFGTGRRRCGALYVSSHGCGSQLYAEEAPCCKRVGLELRPTVPERLGDALLPVLPARDGEEDVGEPVQVAHHFGADRLLAGEGDDQALGAPADGAGDVEVGGAGRAAGEDEVLERLRGRRPARLERPPAPRRGSPRCADRGGAPCLLRGCTGRRPGGTARSGSPAAARPASRPGRRRSPLRSSS